MYDEERPYEVVPSGLDENRRAIVWDTASGLQAVDGLSVSEFAQERASEYISGRYDSTELQERLETHYGTERNRQAEADIVSGRIVSMLESADGAPMRLEPNALRRLHRMLFDGLLPDQRWVGQWRSENIRKDEPVLGGRSVEYADFRRIADYLEFDFAEEREYEYEYGDPLTDGDVRHLADFVTRIWETHPFREGNTRTVAVFAQMMLASHGVRPGNEVFKEKSTWFRDALVRASYESIRDGVRADKSFIHAFFCNLAGANNDLDSMDLNLHGVRVNDVPYRKRP